MLVVFFGSSFYYVVGIFLSWFSVLCFVVTSFRRSGFRWLNFFIFYGVVVLSYTWLLCRCRWPVLILSSRKGIGLPHHTLESIAFIFSLLYFLWLSLCNQRVFFGKFFILCCLQGAPQQGTMCILLESYDLFFGSRLFCVVLLIWRIHKVYCWHLLHCTTVFLLIFVGVLSG